MKTSTQQLPKGLALEVDHIITLRLAGRMSNSTPGLSFFSTVYTRSWTVIFDNVFHELMRNTPRHADLVYYCLLAVFGSLSEGIKQRVALADVTYDVEVSISEVQVHAVANSSLFADDLREFAAPQNHDESYS